MPRDDFPQKIKDIVMKRSAYICSNPNCHNLCIGPTETKDDEYLYFGKVAHITAASEGGSRYDDHLTLEERKSAKNAIFLCSNCADKIDKNQGKDYPKELLLAWKQSHEQKIIEKLSSQRPLKETAENLNSLIDQNSEIFTNLLSNEGINGAFEFKVILCPYTPLSIERSQLKILQSKLNRKNYTSRFFKNFELMPNNFHLHRFGMGCISKPQSNSPFGCMWISNQGIVIFQYNYFDLIIYGDYNRNRLNTNYLSTVMLEFFDIIEEFYLFLSYNGTLKGIFEAKNLKGWWYSPMDYKFPVDEPSKKKSKNNTFEPFEFNYISMYKKGRIRLVEEVFAELLLEFGYEHGFQIDLKILDKYLF